MIASQCEALNDLDFLPAAATDLADRLRRSGGWQPVGETSTLINPDRNDLATAIWSAFELAAERRAALLLAFVGHGMRVGEEVSAYYLMANNSPADPQDETAYNLRTGLANCLNRFGAHIDGLVVLIDACQAGDTTKRPFEEWTTGLKQTGGRLEVLVASDHWDAYDGCFSKTLVDLFDQGVALAGEKLIVSDLTDRVNARCTLQRASHTSYNGGRVSRPGEEDRGLWLVDNRAIGVHALTGRPAAGLLDQVTADVVLSADQRRLYTEITEQGSRRLQAISGLAGSGKTMLMARLIRPEPGADISSTWIAAASFLDATSSAEGVAEELAAQLRTTVDGFAAAHNDVGDSPDALTMDASQRNLLRPLRLCTQRSIRLILDGLDQVPPNQAAGVHAAIAALTTEPELAHVRVIVGIRPTIDVPTIAELRHATVLHLPEPTWAALRAARPDLTESLPDSDDTVEEGGWLTLKLAAALAQSPGEFGFAGLTRAYFQQILDLSPTPQLTQAIMTLLLASGVGPVLPIVVLREALAVLNHPTDFVDLRTVLASLGPLVQRGNPGEATEQVGLSHTAVQNALSTDGD